MSSKVQAREASPGGPYVNTSVASPGDRPTVDNDIPVCAVLLFLYLVSAIANASIYQLNRRKGHKFLMSWAMFGFCMGRVGTYVLRIASISRPKNVRLAIAATIFQNIGVLIIYFVVLLLTLRVFRATHPKLGWNRTLRKTLTVSYYLLGGALLLTIAFGILNVYTLNPTLRSVALWVQRVSILYQLIFNVASLVMLLLSLLLPRAPDNENFGTGSMGSKLTILGFALFFSVFIAGFRMGTNWSAARPAWNPPWYYSKEAFYIILFGFEIIVVYLFLFTRIDRRFWVPNGSSKPGDYSRIAKQTSRDGASDLGTDHDRVSAEDKV